MVSHTKLKALYLCFNEKFGNHITVSGIKRILTQHGFGKGNLKVSSLKQALDALNLEANAAIDYEAFCQIFAKEDLTFYEKLCKGALVVPRFKVFTQDIEAIYHQLKTVTKGAVASYIPELKHVEKDAFSISVCTVDGQSFQIGDNKRFCMQSMIKPVLYALALEEKGLKHVHKHVGREPSGHGFNELTLNAEGLPHNPMINAGAIMSCSMIQAKKTPAARFKCIVDALERLSASDKITFNNAVYNSEKDTADRNYALGYFMREHQAFPKGTDLQRTLNLYFQACSIELNVEILANIAASFAGGGRNPITNTQVFLPETVKNCLSLMYSCGMYDYSGEWAFSIGLPAKSGVSGGIYIVIPGVLGMAIYSPRLDKLGNSYRGIEVCKALVEAYSVHNFDSILRCAGKLDLSV
ncbi:glutaminase A [Fangia hongkongensis]|uniref:glutaminase A n=1 Tax=Fangia hongkongensis TaxID=270495 RepID=UPI000377F8EF|nr:glutaminase A [Fangia hongkongensis]